MVKDSRRAISLEDWTRLSCKRWQIEEILQSPTHVQSLTPLRTDYIHLTLAHFEGQVRSCIFRLWISRTVTERTQTMLLQIHRKSATGFRLVYLHLTLTISQGQSQGHANVEWLSRKRWQLEQTLLLPLHRMSPILAIVWCLHLTLERSKSRSIAILLQKCDKSESCCIFFIETSSNVRFEWMAIILQFDDVMALFLLCSHFK